jgi:hypothetical protein
LSRRKSAEIKKRDLTEMERERISRCSRLLVTEPGVMRSLDQPYISAQPEQRVSLIAGDASVPHRTSAQLVSSYCGNEVARVLGENFSRNGAPLVIRMDRASAHDAPPVLEVLRQHEVLLLHGPPRYPKCYRQHERQNREHRAWVALAETVDNEVLAEMLRALNEQWLRPTLAWRSAAALGPGGGNRAPIGNNSVGKSGSGNRRCARVSARQARRSDWLPDLPLSAHWRIVVLFGGSREAGVR